jgi:outer membrane protein assembly factor BamB
MGAGTTRTFRSRLNRSCVLATVGLWVVVLLGCVLLGQETKSGAGVVARPSTLWHVDGKGRGLPAADSSAVYFLSKYHEVVALDANSGSLLWKRGTGESGETTSGISVVLTGPVVVAGDYDVVAFERGSGAIRWRFAPTDGYGPGIYLGGANGGAVFTGSPAGRLYAIDRNTGSLRWSCVVANDANTTVFQPAVDDDLAVAGYTTFVAPSVGGVIAVDARTGRERWRVAFPRPADASLSTGSAGGPVLVDDLVVAASGDGTIYAFDRTTGSARWSIPRVGGLPVGAIVSTDRDFRALARTKETLVAGSLTGYVVAYDLRTRRERWRYGGMAHGST